METKTVSLRLKKKDGSIEKAKFTFKIPTMGDLLKIQNLASSMSGGFAVDDFTREQNLKIARLMILLIEKPQWFDIDKLSPEYLPLIDKLNEIILKEINFFRPIEVEVEQSI